MMWRYWSNISRQSVKLKLGRKWVLQMDNEPKHTSKVVSNWLKDNKVKVLDWPSQSLNPIENMWAELNKRVRARRPTNLTQLHQLCQEEWVNIHPTYCGKLVEGYPKRLTQVNHFKGNATKYWLSACKLLIYWECDEINKSWNKSLSTIILTFHILKINYLRLRLNWFGKGGCKLPTSTVYVESWTHGRFAMAPHSITISKIPFGHMYLWWFNLTWLTYIALFFILSGTVGCARLHKLQWVNVEVSDAFTLASIV